MFLAILQPNESTLDRFLGKQILAYPFLTPYNFNMNFDKKPNNQTLGKSSKLICSSKIQIISDKCQRVGLLTTR